jgi:hypothetical protein
VKRSFIRPRIVLGLVRKNVPELIVGAKAIHGKMSENAGIFVDPSPSMSVLLAQIGDLEAAQLAVQVRKLAMGMRDQKRDVLWSSLVSEQAYVQRLSDEAPEMAGVYAEAASMKLARLPVHDKPLLEAFLTSIKGDVELRANASLLAAAAGKSKWTNKTYLWRHRVSGATSWTVDESTSVPLTTVHGLPLRVEVELEVAVKDAKGPGEWSQTVPIFVH